MVGLPTWSLTAQPLDQVSVAICQLGGGSFWVGHGASQEAGLNGVACVSPLLIACPNLQDSFMTSNTIN